VFLQRKSKIREIRIHFPCNNCRGRRPRRPVFSRPHIRNQNEKASRRMPFRFVCRDEAYASGDLTSRRRVIRREWVSLHTKTVRWTVFCRRLTKIRREQSKVLPCDRARLYFRKGNSSPTPATKIAHRFRYRGRKPSNHNGYWVFSLPFLSETQKIS
jgi:hypothetical protein